MYVIRVPFVVFALVLGASVASAATIMVDGVACTLPDAIKAANGNTIAGGCRAGNDGDSGSDIIALGADIELTAIDNFDAAGCANGLPRITSTIWIRGNDHAITRAAAAPAFRILDSASGSLTLERTTVSNGRLISSLTGGSCDGGGIVGTVTLLNSNVSHNTLHSGSGGGISGNATLWDSVVSDNFVRFGNGGGINGTSNLHRSMVSLNCVACERISAGARIAMLAAVDPMTGEGGGIAGAVTLVDSVVSGNWSGGELNPGGGLAIDGTGLIVNSTISGNRGAGIGGGIHLFQGTMTLINSTVANNETLGDLTEVSGDGAGIYSSGRWPASVAFRNLGPGGPVTLIHSTVSGNAARSHRFGLFGVPKGAGIYGDAVTLVNTIMAGNVVDAASTPIDVDCFAQPVQFRGVNLVGDESCGAVSANQVTGDPMLAPLGDYGGATPVQPLLPGSPAINRIRFNAGSPCRDVLTDQLGTSRPQNGKCDIGAIEFTGFPLNTVLDNFNRADGGLGTRWVGSTDEGAFGIGDGRGQVRTGGAIAWAGSTFGSTQEAYVTFSEIDRRGGQPALLLKVQGTPSTGGTGAIAVVYDPQARAVQIATWRPDSTQWNTHGALQVVLRSGDQLGGRVSSLGEVGVYRNNVLVGTFTLKKRDQRFFNARGGSIGLLFDGPSNTSFDSFGGGTVAP